MCVLSAYLSAFSWPTCVCVGVHDQKYVCFGFYVHERAYRNVQECVCVWKAAGSPPGPHLLRPDQTMRRGARSGSLRSGTWPGAASK